jgi:hypothetical protein
MSFFLEHGFMNKNLRNLILFGLLILVLYNGSVYIRERAKEYKRLEKRKKELKDLHKKEVEDRRLEEEQKKLMIEKDRKERAERVKAFQQSQKQIPPPTPPPSRLHLYEVKSICEKCRCRLLCYTEQGHTIYIEVAGPDHSAVSDILKDLIKAGAINFTEHREKFGVRMVENKRMYVAAYTLQW